METIVNTENATVSNTAMAAAIRMSLTSTSTSGGNVGVKIFSASSSPSSAPASPTTSLPASPTMMLNQNRDDVLTLTVSPTPPASGVVANQLLRQYPPPTLCTPIKSNSTAWQHMRNRLEQQQQHQQLLEFNSDHEHRLLLRALREKSLRPGTGSINLKDFHQFCNELRCTKPLKVIKERYLVSSHRYQMSAAAAAKTPASYRHLIDLTSSHLRCTDIFSEKQYLCKIINEPLYKVQRAYYQLLQDDTEGSTCTIYGHTLIRGVHDIVPINEQRTYVIIAPPTKSTTNDEEDQDDDEVESESPCKKMKKEQETPLKSTTNHNGNGVDYIYEDLHTYIRNKRRLTEAEARALFHQICQTVQVCHRNGIILRDLKLKRFYFIDEARTKLQYESLEGSMILDDTKDDTLKDKIGCPLYTAPELLCPNTTYRGKPADMWSLGVLLYTMLVGQYPFYEKGNCSLITVIRHCQVQIPCMLTRSVRWLIMALLRKNHEERMKVDEIFLSPWLRQQRPYYMSIKYNIKLTDDDENGVNDDDDDSENSEEEAEAEEEEGANNRKRIRTCAFYEDDDDEESDEDDESKYDDEKDEDHEHTKKNEKKNYFNDVSIEKVQQKQQQQPQQDEILANDSNITNEPLDYTCARLQFVYNMPTTIAVENQHEQQQQQAAAAVSSSLSTSSLSSSSSAFEHADVEMG